MKKSHPRDMLIFKTEDSHFVHLKTSIVEDILKKEDFSFFCVLEKEEQLRFLNIKK